MHTHETHTVTNETEDGLIFTPAAAWMGVGAYLLLTALLVAVFLL